MRWWGWLLVILGVVLSGAGVYVFLQVRALDVQQLSDDLYVLYGLGGNVAVLDSDRGTVLVDTMTLKYQGGRIREVAEGLTGKPVVMVINTHYHTDHTHGNPAFDKGTRVVATESTLRHLKELDSDYFSGPAAALLPNETFQHEHQLGLGNKHLRLVWPGRGHTDGDLVVLFEEEGILHAGDLFFHGYYPNIDLEAGGSAKLWSKTLDRVFELPFQGVIPGHGPYSDRQGMRQFQRFMAQLAGIAADAAAANVPLEEFVKTDALTEDATYAPIRMVVPIGLDREFVLTRAWEEATGAVGPGT